ncbi:hypothetical protein VUR80DRAFT_10370 [Thermomyces stellatus]
MLVEEKGRKDRNWPKGPKKEKKNERTISTIPGKQTQSQRKTEGGHHRTTAGPKGAPRRRYKRCPRNYPHFTKFLLPQPPARLQLLKRPESTWVLGPNPCLVLVTPWPGARSRDWWDRGLGLEKSWTARRPLAPRVRVGYLGFVELQATTGECCLSITCIPGLFPPRIALRTIVVDMPSAIEARRAANKGSCLSSNYSHSRNTLQSLPST